VAVQQSPLSATPDAGVQSVAPRRARKLARTPNVKALRGTVPGVTEGAPLAPAQLLSLPDGSELTLDFASGARVVVAGPAVAAGAEDELDGMLFKEGAASVDLPPGATTPNSGFWLATPAGRIDIVRGGRLALHSFPSGELSVLMVSGSASFTRGTGEAPSRVQALLAPGELLRVGGDYIERSNGRSLTLETALSQVRTHVPNPKHVASAGFLDGAIKQHMADLKVAVEGERALVAAHRQSVRDADGKAMGLQERLAGQAAVLAAARKRLRTLLEQRSAARLGVDPQTSDPLAQQARALLGRAP